MLVLGQRAYIFEHPICSYVLRSLKNTQSVYLILWSQPSEHSQQTCQSTIKVDAQWCRLRKFPHQKNYCKSNILLENLGLQNECTIEDTEIDLRRQLNETKIRCEKLINELREEERKLINCTTSSSKYHCKYTYIHVLIQNISLSCFCWLMSAFSDLNLPNTANRHAKALD